MSDPKSEQSLAAQPRRRRVRIGPLLLGFVIGCVVAGAGTLIVVMVSRERLPQLTRDDLAAAEARWKERGPSSYRLEIDVQGRRAGHISVEVRDDEVVAMMRDGETPRQRRTWDYWSVPNQFEMIARDFASAEDPERGFGAHRGAAAILRGRFDPDLGYPLVYQRQVMGSPSPEQPQAATGAELYVRWETRLEPLPD